MMAADSDPADIFSQITTIQSPEGDTVKISTYGAQVLSWISAAGQENLFMSSKAEFRPGVAIRGGVPVIFPQFANLGKLTKHGFARTMTWELARADSNSAVFWLSETEETYRVWAHRFLAEYLIRISNNRLEMILSIINTDITPFTFTAALHTYIKVHDLHTAAVSGLQGRRYHDSTQAGQSMQGEAQQVIFSAEVDRTYQNPPSSLRLVDGNRTLTIQSTGFPDAVIWNPGAEKCAALPDMEPEGYLHFVCVEAAAASQPIRLATGENWVGTQTLMI